MSALLTHHVHHHICKDRIRSGAMISHKALLGDTCLSVCLTAPRTCSNHSQQYSIYSSFGSANTQQEDRTCRYAPRSRSCAINQPVCRLLPYSLIAFKNLSQHPCLLDYHVTDELDDTTLLNSTQVRSLYQARSQDFSWGFYSLPSLPFPSSPSLSLPSHSPLPSP